jgi:DNA-binding NtrC family response regulator
LRRERPDLPIIIFTNRDQISLAQSFLKQGAADYIFKNPDGIDLEELAYQIDRAWRLASQRRLLEHVTKVSDVDELIGSGEKFLATKTEALRVAQSGDTSVLLTGESGVGKELFARFIHRHSDRAAKPFVPINVANLPGELLESELFGQVKGAFTGAVVDRTGILEAGDGGTVLLDEIGELPLPLQPKLLRVIQDREVRRVGGKASRRLDIRFIFSTNQDLQTMVGDGAFREDLYYRINAYPIMIPPLREHAEDIEPLAAHFLAKKSGPDGKPVVLSSAALDALKRYPFPGNIRELQNILVGAIVRAASSTIAEEDLHLTRSVALDNSRDPGRHHELTLLAREILSGKKRMASVELDLEDYYKEKQTRDFLALMQALVREWKRIHGTIPLLKELASMLSPSRPTQEAQRLSQILKRAGISYAEIVEQACKSLD